MSDVPAPERLVTKPFLVVTAAAAAFFTYVGILVPVVPRFVDEELGAGELGVGLAMAVFAATAICARPVIGHLIERFGRRSVMIGGSLLAGGAGFLCSTAGDLGSFLAFRAVAGVGEAALFVGAATLIADLSPPERRAEGASYFSVAVFGGLGVGPILGDAVLGDGRYGMAFLVASVFACLAAVLSVAAPRSVAMDDGAGVGELPARRGLSRFIHPAAVAPGLVLACGIAGFATFSAFLPEHARDVGFAGSGALFAVYSLVCLALRFAGARLPERLGVRRAAMIAFSTLAVALGGLALFPAAWALWLSAAGIGVASAFLYPSLMAHTINSVDERERPIAISSFTMFFEVGNISGGLVFGLIAELATKRAAFGAAVALCALGAWVLRTHVAPVTRSSRRQLNVAPARWAPVAAD